MDVSSRQAAAFARISLAGAVAATAIAATAAEPARSAEDMAVDAALQGNALAIIARATIRAPLLVIWRTLADYDHLAQFIPGMKSSRVLERRGSTVTVEQIGEARFLIFRYPIAVVVESDEHYPATIAVRVLSGNLRQLVGAYRIETVAGRPDQFVLRWSGIIEPDLPLPLFIAAARDGGRSVPRHGRRNRTARDSMGERPPPLVELQCTDRLSPRSRL